MRVFIGFCGWRIFWLRFGELWLIVLILVLNGLIIVFVFGYNDFIVVMNNYYKD